MLIFKESDYTDSYNTYESTFESTSGEVTRIRYPVTRSTYLENFPCQTNKPSVLLKSFGPFTLSVGDSADPCAQIITHYCTNRMKMSHF